MTHCAGQEWDALMLEMHQIRQALSNSRQELSFSLYMQDAATRVIARQASVTARASVPQPA